MTKAERAAQAAAIVKTLQKDPELTVSQLASRHSTTPHVVYEALKGAGLRAARPDGMGTILTGTQGFRAVVNKYRGSK